MTPTLKWRLTSESGLRWRHWGDRSLVFNPASGDTHLVDLTARTGLACLEAGPKSGEEICQQMLAELELEPETDLRPYVAKLLGHFREVGLVEKAPS
jgi:PqqD family protein of HPr-rel-A system